jgi:hypothetical protein
MALKIYDTLKPQGDYPAVNAEDVQMTDGKRLSDWNTAYPVVDGVSSQTLEPETFYQFGEVSELSVTISDKGDGLAHEYVFEFIPTDGFTEPTISPNVLWVSEPQYPVGKKCIVSVCMGMAVMGCG